MGLGLASRPNITVSILKINAPLFGGLGLPEVSTYSSCLTTVQSWLASGLHTSCFNKPQRTYMVRAIPVHVVVCFLIFMWSATLMRCREPHLSQANPNLKMSKPRALLWDLEEGLLRALTRRRFTRKQTGRVQGLVAGDSHTYVYASTIPDCADTVG